MKFPIGRVTVAAFAFCAVLATVSLVQTSHAQMQHAMPAPAAASGAVPTLPGQDAFGAIQEIVRILEPKPHFL